MHYDGRQLALVLSLSQWTRIQTVCIGLLSAKLWNGPHTLGLCISMASVHSRGKLLDGKIDILATRPWAGSCVCGSRLSGKADLSTKVGCTPRSIGK